MIGFITEKKKLSPNREVGESTLWSELSIRTISVMICCFTKRKPHYRTVVKIHIKSLQFLIVPELIDTRPEIIGGREQQLIGRK